MHLNMAITLVSKRHQPGERPGTKHLGPVKAAISILIRKLRSFDVSAIDHRDDWKANALANLINNTLADIFDQDSQEYEEYSIRSFDTLPDADTEYALGEIRLGYQKGINNAIQKLNLLSEVLEERIRANEGVTPSTTKAESTGASWVDGKVSLVTMRAKLGNRRTTSTSTVPEAASHHKTSPKTEGIAEEKITGQHDDHPSSEGKTKKLSKGDGAEGAGKRKREHAGHKAIKVATAGEKQDHGPATADQAEESVVECIEGGREEDLRPVDVGKFVSPAPFVQKAFTDSAVGESSAEEPVETVAPLNEAIIPDDDRLPATETVRGLQEELSTPEATEEVYGTTGRGEPTGEIAVEAGHDLCHAETQPEECISEGSVNPSDEMLLPQPVAEDVKEAPDENETAQLLAEISTGPSMALVPLGQSALVPLTSSVNREDWVLATLSRVALDVEATVLTEMGPSEPTGQRTEDTVAAEFLSGEARTFEDGRFTDYSANLESESSDQGDTGAVPETATDNRLAVQGDEHSGLIAVDRLVEVTIRVEPQKEEPLPVEPVDDFRDTAGHGTGADECLTDSPQVTVAETENQDVNAVRIEDRQFLETRSQDAEESTLTHRVIEILVNKAVEEGAEIHEPDAPECPEEPCLSGPSPDFPEPPKTTYTAPAEDGNGTAFGPATEPPEERPQNPFALADSEKELSRPKVVRAVDLQAHIGAIQERIGDLRNFDIGAVTQRYDPKVRELRNSVNDTIAKAFGRNTRDYWDYSLPSFEATHVVLGSSKPSPEELKRCYQEGIDKAIAKLTATVEYLKSKLDRSEEALPLEEDVTVVGSREDLPNGGESRPEPREAAEEAATRIPEQSEVAAASRMEQNPFALADSEKELSRPKVVRAVDLQAHIGAIQERIGDLRNFDIGAVTQRYDPKVRELRNSVNDTIAKAFGRNTRDYWDYSLPSFEATHVVLGSSKPSPEELKRCYQEGIDKAIAKLTATVEYLKSKLDP